MDKSETGKYLKYAVGEIFLVVVGILIALSINNWNEGRKKKNTLKNIYSIIADDIRNDAGEVTIALNFMKVRKSLFKKILNDSITTEYLRDNEIIPAILTDIRILNIERRGYNLLRNFENSTTAEKDSLAFRIINFYTSSIFYSEKVENLILEDLIKTNDLWKGKNWYAKLQQDEVPESYISYMVMNQEFKNLCAFRYTLYYDNYEPTIEQFRQGSERILKDIELRFKD